MKSKVDISASGYTSRDGAWVDISVSSALPREGFMDITFTMTAKEAKEFAKALKAAAKHAREARSEWREDGDFHDAD